MSISCATCGAPPPPGHVWPAASRGVAICTGCRKVQRNKNDTHGSNTGHFRGQPCGRCGEPFSLGSGGGTFMGVGEVCDPCADATVAGEPVRLATGKERAWVPTPST